MNSNTDMKFNTMTEPNLFMPSRQNMDGVIIYPQERVNTTNRSMPSILRDNIDKWAKIEFEVGNTIVERIGKISEVGNGYITLTNNEPASTMVCDLSSIKFATFLNPESYQVQY